MPLAQVMKISVTLLNYSGAGWDSKFTLNALQTQALKPRISGNASTTVTSEKLDLHQKIAFLLKFMLCKRNDSC